MVILSAVAALALAACAAEPPVVTETPATVARAALDSTKAQEIVGDTFATLSAADASGDAQLLTQRVEGDAAAVRAAQYRVTSQVAEATLEVLPDDMQRIYVSNSDTWPRIMAAVSVPPDESLTPIVYLWVQESVQDNYELRGWAHMIPGATLPAMPGDVDGATQLPLGETGVDPSPRAALEGYLEYLRQGAASELAGSYAEDSYAAQLFAARDSLAAAAQNAGGAYVDTVQPDMENTFVLSTSDGGALVFAPVRITSSFSVSGATLKVPGNDAALVDGDISTKATYTYQDLVVLSVPAPQFNQLPAVVAAEHHLVTIRPE